MASPARPQINPCYFFEQIAGAERSTLILDFESTLRGGAQRSRPSFPLPTVRELLDCIIMARRSRVIVSSSGDPREVLAMLSPPYPEVWGRNGLERIPATAGEASGVSFCIHPRRPDEALGGMLTGLSAAGPVAYVRGDARSTAAAERLFVRPEFYLSKTEVVRGGAEEFAQFLTDWLRACAGEIC